MYLQPAWSGRAKVEKRIGYYAAIGAAIGLLFGGLWASSSHDSLAVLWGALFGAAIGWFIAAAVTERAKDKDKTAKKPPAPVPLGKTPASQASSREAG